MKLLKKKGRLILMLSLVLIGALNAQNTLLDVTFDETYIKSQNWGIWDELTKDRMPEGFSFIMPTDAKGTGLESPLIVASGWMIWLGGNGQFTDGDAWLTYTLNDLTIGARYEVSSDIETASGWGGIGYTLAMWDTNTQPQKDLASSSCLLCNVGGNTVDLNLSNTFTATSKNMTFGIGMGKDGVYYQRTIIKNWKIIEHAPEEFQITYFHVGTKNYKSNPLTYNIATEDVVLEAPYDSLGYDFAGWYTDAAMTQTVASPAIAQGTMGATKFYAKWIPSALQGTAGIAGTSKSGRELSVIISDIENNTGTLLYQWQSGNETGYTNISGANSSSYILTDNEVSKYVRVQVSSTIQSGQLEATSSRAILAADAVTYTVSYDANGGINGYTIVEEVPVGDNATLSANPEHDGYQLSGWNTQADGNGSPFSTANTVNGNMTVYAQWSLVTYTVLFDVSGSYASKTTDITKSRMVTMPNNPERAGYTFAGWNTQLDGRGTDLSATTIVEENVTVYAQWDIITYTVTFENEGEYATQHVTIEDLYRVTLPQAPEKEGYNFKNWNMQQDGLGAVFSAETVVEADMTVYAQWREIINAIPIAININMKHSVDDVSDFGRERHITSHTGPTDPDFEGHEEMMDYFFNDLDVYFGRDNGSAGWKSKMVTEDPNNLHWPDPASIESVGTGLRNWYESSDHIERHQYESRTGSLIMGMNPYPIYPSLDWGTEGKMNSGWQTYDVDAAAYFVAQYLDKNYAKTSDEVGELLPAYWECMNEPDMAVLKPFVMFLSSFEKLYEFHNLSAEQIRKTLGEYAPKVGGFTWGQHDFWAPDFINRADAKDSYYTYSSPGIYSTYDNMWLGNDGNGDRSTGSTLYQSRGEYWWQWDALYQEFMEICGENMDFYSIHIYDWPSANNGGTIRSGGHIEAMLDMLESYDRSRFGTRKDIIVSEFGSVSDSYICPLGYKRRDWENLRPFNQMFMQFLERPSHLVLTMPFAPIKATWGDYWNADGSLLQRYSVTMMDPVGEYRAPANNHTDWEWSDIILWYELWSDVKGTRVDTKSKNPDIQVDAYVDGQHVYLILNNLETSSEYMQLNMFEAYGNKVKSVKMTHQYLDVAKNRPVNDIKTMASLPAQVKLFENATMILDVEFEDDVTIDQESKEVKYISEKLSNEKNRFGRDKYYVQTHPIGVDFTTQIKDVDVPAIGEATLRLGVRTWNGVKATVKINGTAVQETSHQSPSLNVRGRQEGRGGNGLWCVMEIDVPIDVLQEDNEIAINCPHSNLDISSVQLQVWDMTTTPGRFEIDSNYVQPAAISIVCNDEIMQGNMVPLNVEFSPSNTTNKAIEWASSNPAIVSIDQYGVATANAESGSVTITATSLENGNVFASKSIKAIPFVSVPVTAVSILEGEQISVGYYTQTPLSAKVYPKNATCQNITWSSMNSRYVSVNASTGKVMGEKLGKTVEVIATVDDGSKSYSDTIDVFVTVMGGDKIFNRMVADTIRPYPEATMPVVIRAYGERTVKVKISKDDNVIGQGEITKSFAGDVSIDVPYTLSVNPAIDTEYDITFYLYQGEDLIDHSSVISYMADHYRATSVNIVEGIRSVKKGTTISLAFEIIPHNTYNKKVSWKSLNTSVATVDILTGAVTGVGAGKAEIKVTTDDGGFTSTVEVTVQNEDVVVAIEAINLPDVITMFPESDWSVAFDLVPAWTTQRGLVWSSDNSDIVAVDEDGTLTSTETTGTATLTVKSVEDENVKSMCHVIVSDIIIIEAEGFTTTGGTHDGFKIDETTGETIEWNQSGDWADYEVYFPKTANYSARYFIGAPSANTDIAAKLYVDGKLVSTTKFSPTGAWDNIKSFTSTGSVINEGWHTIRVESSGTSDWQWNADRYEFFISGTSALHETTTDKTHVYPNPAQDVVYISGEQFSEVKAYSLTGAMVLSAKVMSNSFNSSSLEDGIYVIELSSDTHKTTHKLIIQR